MVPASPSTAYRPALALAFWPLAGLAVLAFAVELSLPGAGAVLPGALLTTAGRFCGLFGLGLWVLSLFLMVRPSTLEQACGGLDRVYFLHHGIGVLCYVTLLAHPLFLAVAHGRGEPAQALLLSPSGATMAGWAALLLLMAVLAATFWLPLSYALWRRLHALTAPAFLLGAAHGLALAPEPRWAHGGFMGLALLAGLGALGYRYLLQAGHVRTYDYRVEGVRHPTPEVTEMTLRPQSAPAHWQPGQFVLVAFFDGRTFRGCGEFHPYTIASAERSDGRMTLVVKSLGDCTRNIQSLEPGVAVRLQGPFGGFLQAMDPARLQLWIAGGIGITPFLAAGEALAPDAAHVDLVYLHREEHAPCEARLERILHTHPGLRLHRHRGTPDPDAVWQWLEGCMPHLGPHQVFLCGPPALVKTLRTRLRQAGIAQEDIHSERFDFR